MIMFFTFFSGSPKTIHMHKTAIRIYDPESELIIKLKEFNNVLDSAKLILHEKDY